MKDKYVDNIRMTMEKFHEDKCVFVACVSALRYLLAPFTSSVLSSTQIKCTAKFCGEPKHTLLFNVLLGQAKSSSCNNPDLLSHVCSILFILAKYNSRSAFFENHYAGLDAALHVLVTGNHNEDIVRNLLGIVSLLSITGGLKINIYLSFLG